MVKRVNYFDGQFLRPKDFIDEQAYHLGMRQQHNQFLHSWGIANGLIPSAAAGASRVTVSPGFAIDIAGQEIQLDNAQDSPDLASFAGKSPYVTIAWNKAPSDTVTEEGTSGETRIDLNPVISLMETPKLGQELILGKIKVNAQGSFDSIDTSSAVRTTAGARGGDLSVVSLNLTGLGIDAGQQPRLSVPTAGQVDLKGSLRVNGNLGLTGNAGIGTTSPADQLHVYRSDDKAWSGRGVFSGLTNAAVIGTFQGVAVVGGHAAALNSWSTLYVNTDGKSGGGTTVMGIGGNVGIGTTNPLTRLQVNLTIADHSNRSFDTNALMVVHPTPTSTTALNDPKDVLYIGRQGTSNQTYGAMATYKLSRYENAGGSNVGSRTRLDLALTHDAFDDANAMTWLSSGNVGIGTTSPTAPLHLKDASSSRFTLRIQSAAGNSGNAWGGIGFSGEDANTKGAIIFQSLGANYSRGNMIFALNNAEDQTNAGPANAVMTLTATGVSAPAFIATNPMNDRMYPDDPIVYQDIFAARDAGVIKKYGNPTYNDTGWNAANKWNLRPIIQYGAPGVTPDGNGALVVIPPGYTTVWVRILGERWNAVQARFIDGAQEDLGKWVGGFRSLNGYCPDGSTAEGAWVARDHKEFPGVMAHEWMPIAAGRSGQLLLTGKENSNEFFLSGLAFSKNPWAHATQSAVAFYWISNGGTAAAWNSECWQHDQLARIDAGTAPILKVPVLPSGRDKLLYIVEHNNSWVGTIHNGITVNGTAIERFRTTYNNPFARHWNGKFYERYVAARVPKELIGNSRYLDVRIDLSMQISAGLNFRELGTHDRDVPPW